MTRIAVVGGYGQIPRLLHPLLRRAGHEPVALVRKQEQVDALSAQGVQARLVDLEQADEGDLAAAFEGCQAVVFAAGGGPDGSVERKRTVDLEGSLTSIAGAQQAGISRFVQVSAIGVDDPVAPDAPEVWRAYVEAKRDADAALRQSGLDWTVLRPGHLTDDPATGAVELGERVEPGEVPRADVAAVVAHVLDTGAGSGHQWELVSGRTPVAEAVAALDRSQA